MTVGSRGHHLRAVKTAHCETRRQTAWPTSTSTCFSRERSPSDQTPQRETAILGIIRNGPPPEVVNIHPWGATVRGGDEFRGDAMLTPLFDPLEMERDGGDHDEYLRTLLPMVGLRRRGEYGIPEPWGAAPSAHWRVIQSASPEVMHRFGRPTTRDNAALFITGDLRRLRAERSRRTRGMGDGGLSDYDPCARR